MGAGGGSVGAVSGNGPPGLGGALPERPFGRGNRFMPGFCVSLTDEPVKGMKNIKKTLSDGPLISSVKDGM